LLLRQTYPFGELTPQVRTCIFHPHCANAPDREVKVSKGRFEAFSDGVFAIAITLLVLEIHLPNEPTLTNGEMQRYLSHLWPQLLTYVTSFATVGIIWLNHHSAFEYVRRVDRTTLILNLLLLLSVCFIPFPTALLAKYGPLPSSTVLYGATLTAMGVFFGLVWAHAVGQQRRTDTTSPRLDRKALTRGAIGNVVYLAATLLGFVAPQVSAILFIVVALYYALPGRMDAIVDSPG
jgi:uncharacterized membrane protein